MRFEGSSKENIKIPKELLINDGNPKGPFIIRENAKEIAEKLGWKHIGFKDYANYHGMWVYYAIPQNMDEKFGII